MNRFFQQVSIVPGAQPGNYPLLMFANHFSWWDGFIQYRLNRRVFGRKLYVMMLEEQLRKHMIMNRCGCFSVRKNSRSVIDTFKYASGLMADSANMVLIFPQGEIGSIYRSGINFEGGAEYLMKTINNEYHIVFNVNLINYGSFKKPSLCIYHKTVDPAGVGSLAELEDSYNRFYRDCINTQASSVW